MTFWEVLLVACLSGIGATILLAGAAIWWSGEYEKRKEAQEKKEQWEAEREEREGILDELQSMFWNSAPDEHIYRVRRK